MNVRRIRLDVDWAAAGPRIDAVGEAIAAVDGVEALLITVTEVDMETIGSDVTVEGIALLPPILGEVAEDGPGGPPAPRWLGNIWQPVSAPRSP